MSWFGLVYVETYMCLGVYILYISGYKKICLGLVWKMFLKSRCIYISGYIKICLSLVWFGKCGEIQVFRCIYICRVYQDLSRFCLVWKNWRNLGVWVYIYISGYNKTCLGLVWKMWRNLGVWLYIYIYISEYIKICLGLVWYIWRNLGVQVLSLIHI